MPGRLDSHIPPALRAPAAGDPRLLSRKPYRKSGDARTIARFALDLIPLGPGLGVQLTNLTVWAEGKPGELTDRQLEVVRLICDGFGTTEIARVLKVSTKTVEFHKSRIKNCLGTHKAALITRWAIRNGLIEP